MKQYECLVPGLPVAHPGRRRSRDRAPRRDHLREVHGETVVRPEMIERIKQRIHEPQPAQ